MSVIIAALPDVVTVKPVNVTPRYVNFGIRYNRIMEIFILVRHGKYHPHGGLLPSMMP